MPFMPLSLKPALFPYWIAMQNLGETEAHGGHKNITENSHFIAHARTQITKTHSFIPSYERPETWKALGVMSQKHKEPQDHSGWSRKFWSVGFHLEVLLGSAGYCCHGMCGIVS